MSELERPVIEAQEIVIQETNYGVKGYFVVRGVDIFVAESGGYSSIEEAASAAWFRDSQERRILGYEAVASRAVGPRSLSGLRPGVLFNGVGIWAVKSRETLLYQGYQPDQIVNASQANLGVQNV